MKDLIIFLYGWLVGIMTATILILMIIAILEVR